ncbi:MAG TPA: AAA family ATPase [Chloroflexota bacterium]|jgi:pilus assembly protein CpaE
MATETPTSAYTTVAPQGPALWDRDSSQASAPAILLFTADPALDPLERALQAQGLNGMRVSSLPQARQLLSGRRDRCIAVLDTYHPAPYSFAAIYRLLHEAPGVPTLLALRGKLGPGVLPTWEAAPHLDDYVRLPMPVDALLLRIQALLVQAGFSLPVRYDGGTPDESGRSLGQLIALYGAKGGVGTSTLAANLAVELAQRHGQRVALMDGDLWFGNLATLLDVHSDTTIAALASTADHLDLDVLQEVLVPHSSGVQMVLPPKPVQVETIPAALPARAARAYRALFDYVIVDTHSSMEEYVLQLLEASDRIMLVTTPELCAIHSTVQVLDLAPMLGLRGKMELVLNRANSGVKLEHLEATLDMRVDASVVSAGQRVVAAANRGLPLVLADPQGNGQITRDLAGLAARVMGKTAPDWKLASAAPERKSGWRLGWPSPLQPKPALVTA